MSKVTPHENLVPDTRDGWVNGHPNHDFINNQILAYKFIRAASYFFQLQEGKATFSGYLFEAPDRLFTINLWHEGTVVRYLILEGLGYAGVLHVEMRGDFHEVVGWDLIGYLAAGESALQP